MTSGVPYAEVIGDPIAHSKSPLIHGFWLQKLDLEADYRATRVVEAELAAYLHARRRDPNWRGCNVTMPLKQAVVSYAAKVSRDVESIGAANCLVPDSDTSLSAFNFDVDGVANPLLRLAKANYSNHVATYVYLIGSGGAARAAGLGASRAGYFDFDIFARNREQALILAGMLGTPFGEAQSLEALGPIGNASDGPEAQRYSHVIINATPMGMRGKEDVPVDLSAFYPDTIVFDMVYDPLETGLLRQARERGMRTIDGLTMLVEQAALSFARFFGVPAPREFDAELCKLLVA